MGGQPQWEAETVGKVQNRDTVSTSSAQNVNNSTQNSGKTANNFSSSNNSNLPNGAETKSASGGNFWPNVINKLKEEKKSDAIF